MPVEDGSATADIERCFNEWAIGAGPAGSEAMGPFDQHTLQLGQFLRMRRRSPSLVADCIEPATKAPTICGD